MNILGKKIPAVLTSVISTNWRENVKVDLWQKKFSDQIHSPRLYSLRTIEGETKSLYEDYERQVLINKLTLGEDFRQYFKNEIFWFGRREEGVYPGFIDARDVLLIGEIGLEMMIGLDYSKSQENPSVIYFNNSLLWVEVSPSLDLFLEEVGMI